MGVIVFTYPEVILVTALTTLDAVLAMGERAMGERVSRPILSDVPNGVGDLEAGEGAPRARLDEGKGELALPSTPRSRDVELPLH